MPLFVFIFSLLQHQAAVGIQDSRSLVAGELLLWWETWPPQSEMTGTLEKDVLNKI